MVVTFVIAIWGAYVLRSLYMWALGMVTFWTTRVSALFELVWVVEMLLSGRIVPIALLPGWAQALSWLLPFRWTFGFPITALVGPIDGPELLAGLGMQLAWIVVFSLVVWRFWKVSVRHYTAVGG
jgi:ABC-2 type transport system permease protein